MNENVLNISKRDLDADGYYIGPVDVSELLDGSIEIAADLGWVKFKTSLRARYKIRSQAGSGIEAGGGIKAGWGIKAGSGIEAKWILTPLRIFAGLCLWRLPNPEEMEIRGELRGGTIAHGTHVTTEEVTS